jgi:hypothetical protein
VVVFHARLIKHLKANATFLPRTISPMAMCCRGLYEYSRQMPDIGKEAVPKAGQPLFYFQFFFFIYFT